MLLSWFWREVGGVVKSREPGPSTERMTRGVWFLYNGDGTQEPGGNGGDPVHVLGVKTLAVALMK